MDLSRASATPGDYDTDLESEQSTNLFNDEKYRNLFYQKQTATEITNQLTKMMSLLTSVLNLYLNIGQNSTMNTSQVFMSLQTISIQSLANQEIKQIGQARIRLPNEITMNASRNSTVSVQVRLFPSLFCLYKEKNFLF